VFAGVRNGVKGLRGGSATNSPRMSGQKGFKGGKLTVEIAKFKPVGWKLKDFAENKRSCYSSRCFTTEGFWNFVETFYWD